MGSWMLMVAFVGPRLCPARRRLRRRLAPSRSRASESGELRPTPGTTPPSTSPRPDLPRPRLRASSAAGPHPSSGVPARRWRRVLHRSARTRAVMQCASMQFSERSTASHSFPRTMRQRITSRERLGSPLGRALEGCRPWLTPTDGRRQLQPRTAANEEDNMAVARRQDTSSGDRTISRSFATRTCV